MVLFATDAPPHIANDGKLAGILRPNGMGCYLEKVMYYTKIILYLSYNLWVWYLKESQKIQYILFKKIKLLLKIQLSLIL